MASVTEIRTPRHGWADSSAGKVHLAVPPVRMAGDRRQAALVVRFRDARRAEVIDRYLRREPGAGLIETVRGVGCRLRP